MRKACKTIGDATMVAWMMLFGPIGLVVMVVMTHAVQTGNASLSIICGFFLSVPPVLTGLWGSVAIAATWSESQVSGNQRLFIC
jgi:hypothetical protein